MVHDHPLATTPLFSQLPSPWKVSIFQGKEREARGHLCICKVYIQLARSLKVADFNLFRFCIICSAFMQGAKGKHSAQVEFGSTSSLRSAHGDKCRVDSTAEPSKKASASTRLTRIVSIGFEDFDQLV
jgi:hypothetical protein